MYMSYRWRESFNTVNRQIHDVITTGIDMCGRRMRKGGMDHTSVAALTNQLCLDRGVVRVFECSINVLYTTSMAETNLDPIRKQKNAEYCKRYRLKRKMQQQAPTTSEAEPEKLQV